MRREVVCSSCGRERQGRVVSDDGDLQFFLCHIRQACSDESLCTTIENFPVTTMVIDKHLCIQTVEW